MKESNTREISKKLYNNYFVTMYALFVNIYVRVVVSLTFGRNSSHGEKVSAVFYLV